MKTITSRSNATIQEVAQLKQRKHRYEQQQFIAEGIRCCSTLIKGGMELIMLYVTEEHLSAAHANAHYDRITLVTGPVMEKISHATTASEMVGVFAMPVQKEMPTLTDGIVLANVTDPGNMGTLIRTAAAMDKHTVVVVEGTDPWSPKVIQSTAGTIAFVNIIQLTWAQLLEQKQVLRLCALVVKNGKRPDQIAWHNTLIVIGNEAHGLPHEWIASCEEQITLPMPGNTESLNAAVAGSIALYCSTLN